MYLIHNIVINVIYLVTNGYRAGDYYSGNEMFLVCN